MLFIGLHGRLTDRGAQKKSSAWEGIGNRQAVGLLVSDISLTTQERERMSKATSFG